MYGRGLFFRLLVTLLLLGVLIAGGVGLYRTAWAQGYQAGAVAVQPGGSGAAPQAPYYGYPPYGFYPGFGFPFFFPFGPLLGFGFFLLFFFLIGGLFRWGWRRNWQDYPRHRDRMDQEEPGNHEGVQP